MATSSVRVKQHLALTIDTKQALCIDDGDTGRQQGKDFNDIMEVHVFNILILVDVNS